MIDEVTREPVSIRKQPFVQKTATRICYEMPSTTNPYLAAQMLCQGYDIFELMDKRSFVDVFYLLFRGDLPTKAESELLQTLMIALINPGPRHPATRAAMNAGIGKTNPVHILPIASAVLGGEFMGGAEVEAAMRFLDEHLDDNPVALSQTLIDQLRSSLDDEISQSVIPGFGRRHGGVDPMAAAMADRLLMLDAAGTALKWSSQLVSALAPYGAGWFVTGVAAAVFKDLGFDARTGACLFQLLGAPGLVAHGLEMSHKPINAMPFVKDDDYAIE